MDIFDNEIEIIQAFQDVVPSSVMFAPECTLEGEKLYNEIVEHIYDTSKIKISKSFPNTLLLRKMHPHYQDF